MRFSQNNRIPDLEWDYFAVFGAVFAAILGVVLRNIAGQWRSYLPAEISARNSSTERRAATSKSALDCEA